MPRERIADTEKPIREFYARVVTLARFWNCRAAADLFAETTTPDWTITDHSGKSIPRAKQLRLIRNPKRPDPVAQEQYAWTVKKIAFRGDTATVDSVAQMSWDDYDYSGTNIKNGPRHHHICRTPVRDLWVKTAGVWKIRRTRGFAPVQTVDGKPEKTY
ncbi:MAG: nuclear transport factor 2 family protein [Armatimonadota bacterium]